MKPQNTDLLDPKSGPFEPYPLSPLTKAPLLPILWLKVDLLTDFFWGYIAPLATGLIDGDIFEKLYLYYTT